MQLFISKSIIEKQKIYFDIECLVTLANRVFIKSQLDDDMKVQQLTLSLCYESNYALNNLNEK